MDFGQRLPKLNYSKQIGFQPTQDYPRSKISLFSSELPLLPTGLELTASWSLVEWLIHSAIPAADRVGFKFISFLIERELRNQNAYLAKNWTTVRTSTSLANSLRHPSFLV